MTQWGVNAKSGPIQSESNCHLSCPSVSQSQNWKLTKLWFKPVLQGCVRVCVRGEGGQSFDLQTSCCISSNRHFCSEKTHKAWKWFHTGEASVLSFYALSCWLLRLLSLHCFSMWFWNVFPFRLDPNVFTALFWVKLYLVSSNVVEKVLCRVSILSWQRRGLIEIGEELW